ncbi:MAG: ATP-dependent helicase HrpB [Acidimicrobiia bacterium]
MTLPIHAALPEVRRHLAADRRVVVAAPTGSGKTTGLPPALLDEPWAEGRVVLLEPRRVAARATARYLAGGLGERVGATIGLTTREDRLTSVATRLEVATEGVLTRRLQADAGLDGVSAVVFDEFHERSAAADLALAMALDVADLRDDLRLVVMSATLETGRVAALLGGAPVVTSDTRAHPVEIEYRPSDTPTERAVAAAVARELARPGGDVLAFLPGAREIRRVAEALGEPDGVVVLPLFGALSPDEQDRALRPDPAGRRRVVLATDLAETSLTIDGVTVVVDGGRRRSPRFDPRTGMDRLETVRVSRASADQRAGRAGRTAPGRCIRLWSEAEHRRLEAATPPEVTVTDPTGLVLAAEAWSGGLDGLRLLDLPSPAAVAYARRTLADLGALADGELTDVGRRLLGIPTHPRLAAMLLAAEPGVPAATAAAVAALLEDRDVLRGSGGPPSADLRDRLDALGGRPAPPGHHVAQGAVRSVRREAARLGRLVGASGDPDPDLAGSLLAVAHPERVAAARGTDTYTTVGGRGGRLPSGDRLAGAPFLAIGALDDRGADARILLAAPIDETVVRSLPGRPPETERVVAWDGADVVAERRERVGALVLATTPVEPTPDEAVEALVAGVRTEGPDLLPWGTATRSLRERAQLLHDRLGAPWPDLSDEALTATLEDWLVPFLGGARRRRDLARVDLGTALRSRLGWDLARRVDDLAPTHLEVPSGSRIRLDYGDAGGFPVLAVKLQELFGATTTPTIADGRIPVVVHLLSPAGRPVQVTTDLAGFWDRGYPEVRKELRGRYPKHPWPEDPRTAEPTRRTKR